MILAAITSPLGFDCLVLLVLSAGVLLNGFIQSDRLIRAEHQLHRTAWENDGSPCGFFLWTPGSSPFEGYFAWTRAVFLWLFRTPSWVAPSPEHLRFLRRYRICVITWNIVCLPLLFGIIVSFQ